MQYRCFVLRFVAKTDDYAWVVPMIMEVHIRLHRLQGLMSQQQPYRRGVLFYLHKLCALKGVSNRPKRRLVEVGVQLAGKFTAIKVNLI